MEGVGGTVLSACLDAVIDWLKSIDWLKYVDDKHLLDQLIKWEKMLETIYAVLDDAEETQTTSRPIQIWLTDLKHFTYDLEDVLDELETEVQQHNMEDQDSRKRRHVEDEDESFRPSKRPRLISLAWKWISSLSAVSKLSSSCSSAMKWRTIKFNVEMVSKIDEISARFDEIFSKKEFLKLHESNRRSITPADGRLPSTSLVNEGKIYGREEDKEAILKLLEATTRDADVAVIPIIGMGGVGKTTLAQLVYSDTSLQFDFKAWVCVGVDFNVLRITKTILQSNGEKDLNSLQLELREKLRGQKFLLVLDDYWSEKYEDWTSLCLPFEAGAPGTKIIITTRLQNVARMVEGTLHTGYELKELSDYECLPVFCQHAFGATNLDLKTTGEEIVKRCRGLPLAAKALGGLLRGKSDTDAWEEVLKSKIWDLSDNDILPALRLSYFYLPPHLKRCFAYCSILPQDYEFDRNELVLLWMGEGFLCQQTCRVKQRIDLGYQYFDELLSRSLFQRSNNNESRYVMHDLMTDLARFVSRYQN